MKLGRAFEEKYCLDILKEVASYKRIDDEVADYDAIIDNPNGDGKICVIYAGNDVIDIEDMFTIDEAEFTYRYPSKEAWEAREAYRARFKITEGVELFEEELHALQKETQRIAEDAQLYKEMSKSVAAVSDEEGSNLSRRLFAGGF